MKRVITEATVRRAATSGSALDAAGAVITPAARDLARALGMPLEAVGRSGGQAVGRSGGPAVESAAATRGHRDVIAVGADHGGFPLKEQLKALLVAQGRTVLDLGTDSTAAVDYPDFALAVARAVAEGRAAVGIMVDGAGIGSSMVANKVRGVRAALCYDLTTAANAREHNDANVLTLGGTLIGPRLAAEIVQTFLTTPFGGGRHAPRVARINQLDTGRP